MFWECRSRRIFIGLKSRLKTREIDNKARISKEAKMERKFNRKQKRITPWGIQLSSLIFLVRARFIIYEFTKFLRRWIIISCKWKVFIWKQYLVLFWNKSLRYLSFISLFSFTSVILEKSITFPIHCLQYHGDLSFWSFL